jgi:hypothetical protein
MLVLAGIKKLLDSRHVASLTHRLFFIFSMIPNSECELPVLRSNYVLRVEKVKKRDKKLSGKSLMVGLKRRCQKSRTFRF